MWTGIYWPNHFLFQFSEKSKDFAQAFSLPQTLTRLVQGLWLVDHKEFDVSFMYNTSRLHDFQHFKMPNYGFFKL